jgi:hypothetical protein
MNNVQSDARAHPAFYPMGLSDFLVLKGPELEAHHSLPCSAEVKTSWTCVSIIHVRLGGVVLTVAILSYYIGLYNLYETLPAVLCGCKM